MLDGNVARCLLTKGVKIMYLVNLKTNEAVQLSYDSYGCGETPREWDNLATLWLFDDGSNSDDGKHPQNMEDSLIQLLGENDYAQLINPSSHRFENFRDAFYQLGYKHGYLLQPVTRFKHTQVQYYRGTDAGFDYAICGMIFVSLKDIRQEYHVSRITKAVRCHVLEVFDGELKLFTNYANGEVYSIDYYADASNLELTDSVSGIYLSDNESPDDPQVIFRYAEDYFDISDKDSWVPAKTLNKVFLEPDIATVKN